MNRIREIREALGLTLEDLGRRVGVTRTQMGRLEKGTRRLTDDYMRRIGQALGVHPADLLADVALAEIENDITPAPDGDIGLMKVLRRKGFRVWRVRTDAVEMSGIRFGETVIVDESPEAIGKIASGDVVAVEMTRPGRPAPVVALRQFLAPHLVVTNRAGTNVAVQIGSDPIGARIVGVVVRE